VNRRVITGYTTRNSGGVPENFRNYFVVKFDKQFDFYGIQKDGNAFHGSEAEGNHVQAMVGFQTKKGEQVVVRVASSFISPEQAELVGDWSRGLADASYFRRLGTIWRHGFRKNDWLRTIGLWWAA
jgi:putative alpha-1,2-mannosidase